MSVYIDILKNKTEPILFENEQWFVLFAKKPLNEGHLLIIPKFQVEKFYDLSDDVLCDGFRIATYLSKMLKEIYKSPQVFLFIKGFSNDDHAHIHVAPAYKSEDLNVDHRRPILTIAEMEQLSKKLKPHVQAVLSKNKKW